MPQSYSSLHIHFVFSTKDRQPHIVPEIQQRLYGYIGGIAKGSGCSLKAAGGVADHVHLLISMSRQTSPADLMRDVKTNSSKWIHDTFAEHSKFAWQSGYGAFAVSSGDLDRVKQYIDSQVEHHRQLTFREEFLNLLDHHGIEYDEQYLWV